MARLLVTYTWSVYQTWADWLFLNGVLGSRVVWFRRVWVSDADCTEELNGSVTSGASGAGDFDGADESGCSDGWALHYSTTRFVYVSMSEMSFEHEMLLYTYLWNYYGIRSNNLCISCNVEKENFKRTMLMKSIALITSSCRIWLF